MEGKVFQQFEEKTLEDFEIRYQDHRVAVDIVEKYLEELREGPVPRGLTFCGPTGTGKTHLACVVVKAANKLGLRTECIEMSTYIHFHFDLFKQATLIGPGKDDENEEYHRQKRRLDYIQGWTKKGSQLLLLDDIGREHESGSGWSNEQLFDLIRFRFNRGKATILTSNWSLEDLQQRYGEGLASFLYEATEVITLNAEDYRAPRGTGD